MEDVLYRFYKRDIATCPDDKSLRVFVAVSCPSMNEYDLWSSQYSVLSQPKYPALLGWEHAVYTRVASRLVTCDLTLAQAMLASIYTLTVAKQTSNCVGGDLSVAIVRGSGIWMEKKDYIDEMEARLASYETQINKVLLTCADTTVSMNTLQDSLQQFSLAASTLHRTQIDRYVESLTLEKVAAMNEPYPKGFPLGSSIIFKNDGTPPVLEHDEGRNLDVYAKAAWLKFTPLGYTEHFIKNENGRFQLSISGRWTGLANQEIFSGSLDELINYCSDKEMLPQPAPIFLPLLQVDGSEAFCYLRPKQSTSQTSEQVK